MCPVLWSLAQTACIPGVMELSGGEEGLENGDSEQHAASMVAYS